MHYSICKLLTNEKIATSRVQRVSCTFLVNKFSNFPLSTSIPFHVTSLWTRINVKMVTLLLKIFLVIICEICHGCNMRSYYDTSAANTVFPIRCEQIARVSSFIWNITSWNVNSCDHLRGEDKKCTISEYRNEKERLYFV